MAFSGPQNNSKGLEHGVLGAAPHSWSTQAAVTEYYRLGRLGTTDVYCSQSGGWKPKVKVPARLPFGEGLLPGS